MYLLLTVWSLLPRPKYADGCVLSAEHSLQQRGSQSSPVTVQVICILNHVPV